MKSVTINEHTYELLKDYREGFELPEVEIKLTPDGKTIHIFYQGVEIQKLGLE